MCVIVLKFKGTDFPSKEVINACMQANPDGFAAAWNQDGRLMTFRTMDGQEMLAKYDEIRHLDPATTGLVFHARIATHGSKKLENCHCWTDEDGSLAFAHNGILNNIGSRDDLTDSETFFRDIFLPVRNAGGMALAAKVAHAIIGTSRFAFINADGNIVPMGNYSKDQEEGHNGKVYFSNMNWVYKLQRFHAFDKPATKKKNKDSKTSTAKTIGEAIANRDRMALPWTMSSRNYGYRRPGSLVVERDDDGKIVRTCVKNLNDEETEEPKQATLF